MSPQPTNPPAPPAPEPPARDAELDAFAEFIADLTERAEKAENGGPALAGVEKQLLRAVALERQRSKLMKAIAANREYLRLMHANGEFDDFDTDDGDNAHVELLETFYPQKEKGSKRTPDEVARTRKAKQAARG